MRTLIVLAAAALGAVVSALVLLYVGFYDVAATRQHLAPTYWLLETGMRESVKHHARPIAVPPLADAALVERGLAQYREHCVRWFARAPYPWVAMGGGGTDVVGGLEGDDPAEAEQRPRRQGATGLDPGRCFVELDACGCVGSAAVTGSGCSGSRWRAGTRPRGSSGRGTRGSCRTRSTMLVLYHSPD